MAKKLTACLAALAVLGALLASGCRSQNGGGDRAVLAPTMFGR